MLEIHFDYSKRMQTIISHKYDDDQDRRLNTTVIYDDLNVSLYPVDAFYYICKFGHKNRCNKIVIRASASYTRIEY